MSSLVTDEILTFLATDPIPEQVVAFRPLEKAKLQVADLIGREKRDGLSAEETAELDHYMQVEYLMRMVKAHAHHPVNIEKYESFLETLQLMAIPGFYESIQQANAEIEAGGTASIDEGFGEE